MLFSLSRQFHNILAMNLNFFCDIDGTLLPFGKGLPDSAKEAIVKAQRQGHRFFLSTGRSPKEVDPRLDVIQFDGGVYSNGVTVIYKDKTVLDVSLSEGEMKELFDYADERGFLYMLQSDGGTYMTGECKDFFIASMKRYIGRVIDVPNIVVYDRKDGVSFPPVRKFLFLSPDHRMDEARRDMAGRYQIIDNTVGLPQSDMAEICLLGYTKATGIKTMISSLGETMASTVAIGDGANDREMLFEAELGIAMGNAPPDVQEKADWVTTSVDDDGMKRAIEYALSPL